MPAQSIVRSAPGSELSSTAWRASIAVKTISGTFTQKIARHESASISAPPPAGPITVAIPVQAVQVPTAFPRSAPSKVAARMASEPGTRRAPASPCRPREAIRTPLLAACRDRGDAEQPQPDDEDAAPAE